MPLEDWIREAYGDAYQNTAPTYNVGPGQGATGPRVNAFRRRMQPNNSYVEPFIEPFPNPFMAGPDVIGGDIEGVQPRMPQPNNMPPRMQPTPPTVRPPTPPSTNNSPNPWAAIVTPATPPPPSNNNQSILDFLGGQAGNMMGAAGSMVSRGFNAAQDMVNSNSNPNRPSLFSRMFPNTNSMYGRSIDELRTRAQELVNQGYSRQEAIDILSGRRRQ